MQGSQKLVALRHSLKSHSAVKIVQPGTDGGKPYLVSGTGCRLVRRQGAADFYDNRVRCLADFYDYLRGPRAKFHAVANSILNEGLDR